MATISTGIAVATLSVIFGFDGSDRLDIPQKSPMYYAGYIEGISRAKREIATGNTTLYSYGNADFFTSVDKETGLPFLTLGPCNADDATIGMVQGHNDTVRRIISVEGIPDWSYKQWEKHLFNIASYFEDASSPGEITALVLDGPPFELEAYNRTVRAERVGIPSSNRSKLLIKLECDGKLVGEIPLHWQDVEIMIRRGPPESRLLFLRGRKPGYQRDVAIDVINGRRLRVESTGWLGPS